MNENNKDCTILIVDDTPENIEIISNILKDKYLIKVSVDGFNAIKIAGSDNPPDLILLDIFMPGMSGYEVCRELKACENTRDIPVIFITASMSIEDLVKGFELGGVDYIIKPFNKVELLARIDTQIKLKIAGKMLKYQNVFLEEMVDKRTRMLQEKNDILSVTLKEKEKLLSKLQTMEKRIKKALLISNKLYNKIQTIQEEERKQISMDIHDEMGQLLTVIKLNLYQIQSNIPDDDKLKNKVSSTIQLVDNAVYSVQKISKKLRPDILVNLGFIDAVKSYCRTIEDSETIKFDIKINCGAFEMKRDTEMSVYRAIQEALTNVIRHSNADKCSINIEISDGFLKIRISDNGVGIDRKKISDINSLGIYSMKKRISKIKGKLYIEGNPDSGTIISFSVPIGDEKND